MVKSKRIIAFGRMETVAPLCLIRSVRVEALVIIYLQNKHFNIHFMSKILI